jgi:calcineurin-like phosphoesterase family protein
MQRFDKFLLSMLKTICGLDIIEFLGCMMKKKNNGKKAKWILHRLRGLIEYDIQQEFLENVKHSNDRKDAQG